MTPKNGKEGREAFKPSDAAMDEYYASRRRNIRPALVSLSMMALVLALREFQAPVSVLLAVIGVWIIWSFVLIAQNYTIQRRADQRLKAEKHEWQAQQTRRS
jgi:hypothetical protein